MYAGIARDGRELEQALALAAESFSPPDAAMDAAISRKAFLLREHPGFREDSAIVVCAENGCVAGSAFLIDCELPVGDCLLQGVFISSVSVAEQARGQGLSLLLMESAIKAATVRDADIAMLIARRAVDGYYTRFGFWGLSQYSKVTLNIATLPPASHPIQAVTLRPVAAEDFGLCAELHAASYRNLIGHCVRSPKMWGYISRKLPYLGMRLDFVRIEGQTVSYVIHDGRGNLHEIGVVPGGPVFGARPFLEAIAPGLENLTLHLPPTHPFLIKLEGADVSLTLRECPYGGHMVRILNPALVGSLRGDVAGEVDTTTERTLSFAETAKLLRLARVSDFDSALELGLRGSFNIPLLDQI